MYALSLEVANLAVTLAQLAVCVYAARQVWKLVLEVRHDLADMRRSRVEHEQWMQAWADRNTKRGVCKPEPTLRAVK